MLTLTMQLSILNYTCIHSCGDSKFLSSLDVVTLLIGHNSYGFTGFGGGGGKGAIKG